MTRGGHRAEAGARSVELQIPDRVGRLQGSERQRVRVKFWLRTNNRRAWRIFGAGFRGAGFRRASQFVAEKILAIPCRANTTDITKDLRKVLLGLEATGYGHVQYSRTGSTQHRPSTLEPLAQNKLMRGLAR